MSPGAAIVIAVVATGAIATVVMDVWMLLRRRLLALPLPDYALVGRWLVGLMRGRLLDEAIASSPAVPGERWIGWLAHYSVGVFFAAGLVAWQGAGWLARPTPWPALLFGVATVAFPFFVMQPGMGAGIAASRTPRPAAARIQSVLTHAVFGLGLCAGAWLVRCVRLAADGFA